MAGSGDRVVARRPRLLSHADVLHAGVGEEAFLEYLGESPGGERGVHPPEGQELAPGKARLEVLADGGAVLLEEAPAARERHAQEQVALGNRHLESDRRPSSGHGLSFVENACFQSCCMLTAIQPCWSFGPPARGALE
jgi:hypothetical protein